MSAYSFSPNNTIKISFIKLAEEQETHFRVTAVFHISSTTAQTIVFISRQCHKTQKRSHCKLQTPARVIKHTKTGKQKSGVTLQTLVLLVEHFHIFCTDWLCNVKLKIMIMSSVINRQLAAMKSCEISREKGALCNALKLSDPHLVFLCMRCSLASHLKHCAASMQQRSIFEPKPQSQLNLSESHFCLN